MFKKILPILVTVLPLCGAARAAGIVNVDVAEPPTSPVYSQSNTGISTDYIWNNTSDGLTVSNNTFKSLFEVNLTSTAGDIDVIGTIENFGGSVSLSATGGNIYVRNPITSHLGDIVLNASTNSIETSNISLVDSAEMLSVTGATGVTIGDITISSGQAVINSSNFIRVNNLSVTYDFPTGIGDPDPVPTTLTATNEINILGNVSNSGNGGITLTGGAGITVGGTVTNSDNAITINPGIGQNFSSAGVTSNSGGRIVFGNGANFGFGAGGLSAAGDLFIGHTDVGTDGDVYFASSATLAASGARNITGGISIETGNSLQIGGPSSAKVASLTAAGLYLDGNFTGYVSGATTLVGGIDIGSATNSNNFYLETGTLTGVSGDIGSHLASYTLNVLNGGVSFTNIYNGSNVGAAIDNVNSDMSITATSITATSDVINVGNSMTFASSGNIVLSNDLLNGTLDGSTATAGAVGAVSNISSSTTLSVRNIVNFGDIIFSGTNSLNIYSILNNGNLFVSSALNTGTINISDIVWNTGNSALGALCTNGTNCDLFMNANQINIGNRLTNESGTGLVSANTGISVYQILNSGGDLVLRSPTINIGSGGIYQTGGTLELHTDNLNITGNGIISAGDTYIYSATGSGLINANIMGDVSGGVKFLGVGSMNITGDYYFNSTSQLLVGLSNSSHNSTIDISNGNISGGTAIVNVSGNLITNNTATAPGGTGLSDGSIGLYLTNIVDSGDAVYLLRATEIQDLQIGTRNLNVMFCNLDGSRCFNYLDAFRADQSLSASGAVPAYLSVKDVDGDGLNDSIYIVFDPRFGGPISIFKIQPIVGKEPTHTANEYASAGALDNLVEGVLIKNGFVNNTPIEAMPSAFLGSDFQQIGNEIYNRMEYYNSDNSKQTLYMARFAKMFEPIEAGAVAMQIDLDERMNYRQFENKLVDEFLLNRTRNLKKVWVDTNVSFFNDSEDINGNRLSVSAGMDWQHSKDTIMGVTARFAQLTSNADMNVDLSYANVMQYGAVRTEAKDTSFSLGAYLIRKLSQESSFYSNLNFYNHSIDVSRSQTFFKDTDGTTTAMSVSGEFGIMHDLLNKYIVGNAYLRGGYNSGFTLNLQDYMNAKQDGFISLTPGYSLAAQKRIYATPWLQLLPKITTGFEYNLLGAKKTIDYKFIDAVDFSKYDTGNGALWFNIGTGIDIISARGGQLGLDYRFQTNGNIQSHNIRLGGGYRF